jgi:hypothetical protein
MSKEYLFNKIYASFLGQKEANTQFILTSWINFSNGEYKLLDRNNVNSLKSPYKASDYHFSCIIQFEECILDLESEFNIENDNGKIILKTKIIEVISESNKDLNLENTKYINIILNSKQLIYYNLGYELFNYINFKNENVSKKDDVIEIYSNLPYHMNKPIDNEYFLHFTEKPENEEIFIKIKEYLSSIIKPKLIQDRKRTVLKLIKEMHEQNDKSSINDIIMFCEILGYK